MLHWLLTAALLAGSPTGQLTIKTRDLQVVMTSKVGWTISSVDYQGQKIILPLGGQGAILSQGGKWYGAGGAASEGDAVSTFDVKADSLETDVKGNMTASGDRTTLHKEATIFSLRHAADTTFGPDRIVQRHQFEATEDLPATSFFAFAYSLTPSARQWMAQPVVGELMRGEFNADGGNKPGPLVRWLAQYDPANQKGVMLYYQQPVTGSGAATYLWDTDTYHKSLCQPSKGPIVKGTKLDLTLVMQFFSAAPEAWEAQAQKIASELQTEFPQTVAIGPPAARVYGQGVPEEGFLTLKTAHYTVPFAAKQAWTIYKIEYDGQPFSHERGFHGTVMIPKGSNFIGTGHTEGGREVVHSLKLTVDGEERAWKAGETVSGHKLTLLKHSTIWKFDCTTEVTVRDDHVYERTTLEAREPTDLSLLYYFMHCFQPTSTKWLAQLPSGESEQGDLTSDGKFRVNKDTRWVAQYDPTRTLGVLCYTPKVIAGPGSASLIWDLEATRYHKYYLRYTTGQSFKVGDKLDYCVIVKAVPGEKEDFSASKGAAAGLAKEYSPVE